MKELLEKDKSLTELYIECLRAPRNIMVHTKKGTHIRHYKRDVKNGIPYQRLMVDSIFAKSSWYEDLLKKDEKK